MIDRTRNTKFTRIQKRIDNLRADCILRHLKINAELISESHSNPPSKSMTFSLFF